MIKLFRRKTNHQIKNKQFVSYFKTHNTYVQSYSLASTTKSKQSIETNKRKRKTKNKNKSETKLTANVDGANKNQVSLLFLHSIQLKLITNKPIYNW